MILAKDLEKVKAWVLEYFQKEEVLGIATLKDAFSTSRKCAKAMIQYFDREKITKKVPENRSVWPGPLQNKRGVQGEKTTDLRRFYQLRLSSQ